MAAVASEFEGLVVLPVLRALLAMRNKLISEAYQCFRETVQAGALSRMMELLFGKPLAGESRDGILRSRCTRQLRPGLDI